MSTLQPGYRHFRFGETLKHVDRPDFALKIGADLLVGMEGTAILRPSAFDTLLGDVGITFERVPADVASVANALASKMPLTNPATRALEEEVGKKVRFARRLRVLTDRVKTVDLDPAALRLNLERHGVDATLLLNDQDEFSFDATSVGLFLDVLEARYFEGDLSGQRRRADRFSTR